MARKVIFIRGPQGSGKSTLVRRAGLEGYTLSLDKIRDVLAGDMLNPNGQFTPSHENEALAFTLFQESCARRIAKGEVVVIDGTLADGKVMHHHWQGFRRAGYATQIIDLYGFDRELARERNAARPERARVPEASVAKMIEMAARSPIPEDMRAGAEMIHVRNDEEAENAVHKIRDFLSDPRCVRVLSTFDRVVHIGDLQGCFAPLVEEGSPLKDGLDPRTFYVFLGDLFDRGPENGKVGRWFMDEIYGRPNVALIAGNHEDYVDKQARAGKSDIGLPQSEWQRFSWPDLKRYGLTPEDCARISDMSQDYLAYYWRGREVLCSHAGFAKWPEKLHLVSQHQMRRGNGRYEIDVDAAWTENEAQSGRYQIHGHRNSAIAPTLTSKLSMNLEAQVEFGGHMRFVTLDEGGFTPIDIRNRIHRTMQQDIAVNRAVERVSASKHAPLMPWIERGEALAPVSQASIDKLHDHDMIGISRSESLPGVFSANFTHAAFNNAAWDDYTTVARGLFIDGETGTIVARSYEKFFNLGERPETARETIASRVSYPVDAYEKANGFLGITGYSERHGALVIASKSRIEGDFPDIARDVIEKAIGRAGMERMLRFNRDQQASLVFEIEDPERDPHIIKLDKPRIVLLACIRRSETFEQAPYEDLKAVAKWLGCEVKQCLARLPNERALESFNRRVECDPNWGVNGKPLEGCVMEAADGSFYKLKSAYYRNWKRMRSAVHYMRKAKLEGREAPTDRFAEMGEPYVGFLDWAKTLSATALELDIITLREAYEGDPAPVEAIEDPEGTTPDKEAERRARFEAVIEQIAANERISEDGLRRFVTSALEDEEKAEILRAHALGEELIERAGLQEFADFEP